ncbi:reverse transcriptase domain-containing protein [Tanacetum coccineum]|uniref:Reverse transcriptase domain-containing protein n=1 Tax=Tanacetum coccineum TaxID=301880 RepID=A0ABQ4WAS4_9ASTR
MGNSKECCFECGAPGHFRRDCPKLKNKDGGNGNAQGWVYAVGNAESGEKEMHRKSDDANVVRKMGYLVKIDTIVEVGTFKILRPSVHIDLMPVVDSIRQGRPGLFITGFPPGKRKTCRKGNKLEDVPIVENFQSVSRTSRSEMDISSFKLRDQDIPKTAFSKSVWPLRVLKFCPFGLKTPSVGRKKERTLPVVKARSCVVPQFCFTEGSEDFVDYTVICVTQGFGKANVVADALSRKERIEPLRVRALVMTIGLDLPKRILEAQIEAQKPENIVHAGRMLDNWMWQDTEYLPNYLWFVRMEDFNLNFWRSFSKALGKDISMSMTYIQIKVGQCERTIQTLEDLLLWLRYRFWQGWVKHLPLAPEIHYNIQLSRRHKGAPNEALYGRNNAVNNVLDQARMQAARIDNEDYAESERKPMEFSKLVKSYAHVSPWERQSHALEGIIVDDMPPVCGKSR